MSRYSEIIGLPLTANRYCHHPQNDDDDETNLSVEGLVRLEPRVPYLCRLSLIRPHGRLGGEGFRGWPEDPGAQRERDDRHVVVVVVIWRRRSGSLSVSFHNIAMAD